MAAAKKATAAASNGFLMWLLTLLTAVSWRLI
jgi:hypothetical protein